jgi:plasmid maintenance system killer protein
MGQSIKSFEEYTLEAIKNIRDDRDITSTLLTKLFIEMNNANDANTHKELGLIASKYVETLQRSNEQLVKLTSILSKKQDTSISLDEKDKKELFDIIQGEKK